MRFHSDILSSADISTALMRAKDTDHVDRRVHFMEMDFRGSRTRRHAYEIRLAWYGKKIKGDGRHHSNTGTSGADSGGYYAATYDEWGWFIAELFAMDPNPVFGPYKGLEDFRTKTNNKYLVALPHPVPVGA